MLPGYLGAMAYETELKAGGLEFEVKGWRGHWGAPTSQAHHWTGRQHTLRSEQSDVLVPTAFCVSWSCNVAALVALVRRTSLQA
jgi:hypothetical protein